MGATREIQWGLVWAAFGIFAGVSAGALLLMHPEWAAWLFWIGISGCVGCVAFRIYLIADGVRRLARRDTTVRQALCWILFRSLDRPDHLSETESQPLSPRL